MNKVMLIGRFTRDPESRMTQSNMEVSRFSLACSSDFVNRNGEKETEFINCVAFNRTASTINRYCKKGQLISVTGRIRNSSYDAQDGTKRYTTDVVVDNFEFLGSRQGGQTNDYQSHVCRIIVIPVIPNKEQNSKNIKQTDQMTINFI